MSDIEFFNPPKDVKKRDFYGKKSPNYDLMMNLLHSDAQKTPRIYYCGTCHSIETVSTYVTHKKSSLCEIYSRGQILGLLSNFILYKSLGSEKKDTITKIMAIADEHGHVENQKIRSLYFTKYASQAEKIQKKKGGNRTQGPSDEMEEEKTNFQPKDEEIKPDPESPKQPGNFQNPNFSGITPQGILFKSIYNHNLCI